MILKEQASLQMLYLRALHLFGRNVSKADTVLVNQDASQIHASIRWLGNQWELLDHSRNGTFVDGERVVSDVRVVLAVGQKIRFGPGSVSCWVVEDLAPPTPLLVPVGSDDDAIELQSLHFLPNEMEPQASIHYSAQGLWVWQSDGDSVALQDGDTVHLGSACWRFFNAKRDEATLDFAVHHSIPFRKISFNFSVSLNEEHVVLNVKVAGRQADLGERTHHYSLLTLARRRKDDAQRGLDASTQGWLGVEQLSKMLGVAQPHLNMQLFRARGQLAKQFPDQSDLLDVVERRRGEVRFAAVAFEIMRGTQLEARFDPF